MRIYIASLAHYNAGKLVGKWFDVEPGLADDVQDCISSLTCDGQQCEEWAIHDYECEAGSRVSESADLDQLVELAEVIDEHGEAYVLYAQYVGDDYATVTDFQDAYRGCWKNEEDFADDYFENFYASEIPEHLHTYFDVEQLSRDLFCGTYFSCDGSEGCHVFLSQ